MTRKVRNIPLNYVFTWSSIEFWGVFLVFIIWLFTFHHFLTNKVSPCASYFCNSVFSSFWAAFSFHTSSWEEVVRSSHWRFERLTSFFLMISGTRESMNHCRSPLFSHFLSPMQRVTCETLWMKVNQNLPGRSSKNINVLLTPSSQT